MVSGRPRPQPMPAFNWHRFSFHALTQVPRVQADRDQEREGGDPRLGSLAMSLAGAHAALLGSGEPIPALASAWIRARPGGRVHVLLGGRPFFPPAASQEVVGEDTANGEPTGGSNGQRPQPRPVLFPVGAAATAVAARSVVRLIDQFSWWVACSGRADALWAPPAHPGQDRPATRRGSFDRHVATLRVPLVWLVVAEPLLPDDLRPELDLLTSEILPLSRGEVGETRRVALERKQLRHRELSRAQVGGAWRIRVLVGGTAPGPTAVAAAMLCGAAELDGLPYVLAPAGQPAPFADAIQVKREDPLGARNAFIAGTELLAALTRPPERELPGLRVVNQHTFDVTPEISDPAGLSLGEVLDESGAVVGSLALSRDTLNRHLFVCGATGTGKSHTVRHLLTQASRAGLPWLVIEPAKAEYARIVERLASFSAEVVVIRPGDKELPPAGLNPLEPEPGFPLQTHVDLLRALFLAAFEAHEPFPQVLATALTRCYEKLGWDLALGEPARPGPTRRFPTLSDLERAAATVVAEIGYGKDIAADVQGFIKVRLSSLRLGTTGRFFEGGHPLDFTELRSRNVIFEIQDVGDDADKSFLMGAILIRLTEHLRMRGPRGDLDHLTVIEEAHRLLRRLEPGAAGPASHAVEMFAALLAEVRAYGEGIIIAEQIPSKLIPDVIKNTAVKIMHRLPAKDDRDAVGATMNLDDRQSRHVVSLIRGQAAVTTDGMDNPILLRVPSSHDLDDSSRPRTASLIPLIKPRSSTCPSSCAQAPCSLRQIRDAQHILSRHSWLVLLVELTVVAHLTGRRTPELIPGQASLIDGMDQRELDCAISHAVDAAVAVRAASLQPDADQNELAIHCLEVLRLVMAEITPPCNGDNFAFLAEQYKWAAVYRELSSTVGEDGPHPDTPQWERRHLRKIPGVTRAEQRDVVERWYDTAIGDWEALDAVTFGSLRPSTIELMIGNRPVSSDWSRRVVDSLAPFDVGDWPVMLLVRNYG
ncbi:ATP-binding protein [Frankia sp. AgB32]|uniref:helicase HerA-like domain-containing protein n=1 Tax=Frankia sp. AgB32 TaxID=631119 RepID=UPI00200EB352|nr:ATP-binding protein [Frankia sp. AgB32]MCK9895072.1 ATP-binding protein [Frankia sp. AgB32]